MSLVRALARLGVVAAPLVGLALVAAPASAVPKGVAAVGSCYFDNGNGTITAVFGYTNTGSTTTIPVGANNQVYTGTSTANYTAAYPAAQPTTFLTGGQSNVFAVTGPPGGGAAWFLNGAYATVMPGSSSLCPQGSTLPTGDGVVLTLVAAAGMVPVGCWLLGRRSTRLAA